MDPEEQIWAISSDGELYDPCDFSSKEEAIAEGEAYYDGEPFYVGRCVRPPSPATYWSAADWLDHVNCQEEYGGEWAEGWDADIRHEQILELETAVKAVMQAWLEKNGLLPRFYNIEEDERITPDDCQCIDCGGTEPHHSSNCAYMREIAGVDEPCLPENSQTPS